ncbi:MAG: TrkH family potassium uptake protein [Henriciella sp.]
MHLRTVTSALGIMTALLGGAMLPCVALDIADAREEWEIFAGSAAILLLFGTGLVVLTGLRPDRTGAREAFLLTVLVWVALPAFAALPFLGIGMSITDAMFESISGLTTTGATVLTNLDSQSRGLLLWRAILQWFGGIGIIVTAIAILPALRVGGMQLFKLESSDMSGKFMPRIEQIATQTGLLYVLVSIACMITYAMCGMTTFDAVAHAMTTVSAGGYSTHDASFETFLDTPAIFAAIFYMIIAGLPFSLMTLILFHGRWRLLTSDPQVRLFISIWLSFAIMIVVLQLNFSDQPAFDNWLDGLSLSLFNVISILTGTGYASTAYDSWGDPTTILFLILTFLGGCAGSAACGIKMFRLEIAFRAIMAYSKKMVSPHRVIRIRFGGKLVNSSTLQSVMVFVFLYLATFIAAAILLSLTGLDSKTAISGAATSVSNVGPGLGPIIGPSGTFQPLSDPAKWICATAMLLGRLEFTAVFVLATRRFWRG